MAVIRSVGEKVDCNTQFINKLKSGNCRLCHLWMTGEWQTVYSIYQLRVFYFLINDRDFHVEWVN